MPFGVPIVVGGSRDFKLGKNIEYGFLHSEYFISSSTRLDEKVRQSLSLDMIGMRGVGIDLLDRDLEHDFDDRLLRVINRILMHNCIGIRGRNPNANTKVLLKF